MTPLHKRASLPVAAQRLRTGITHRRSANSGSGTHRYPGRHELHCGVLQAVQASQRPTGDLSRRPEPGRPTRPEPVSLGHPQQVRDLRPGPEPGTPTAGPEPGTPTAGERPDLSLGEPGTPTGSDLGHPSDLICGSDLGHPSDLICMVTLPSRRPGTPTARGDLGLLWSNFAGHLNRWKIHHLRNIKCQGNARISTPASNWKSCA
jgi:hypothetical protein